MQLASHSHAQTITLERGHKVFGKTGRTGMSRSAFYTGMAAGTCPRPVKIGLRAVAWKSNEIDALIASFQKAA